MSLPVRWTMGAVPTNPSLLAPFLESRLRELEDRFNQLCDVVEFSSFFPVTWNMSGTVTTGAAKFSLWLPLFSRPRYFSAVLPTSGSVTLDLNAAGTSLLTAPIVITGAGGGQASSFIFPDLKLFGVPAETLYTVDFDAASGGAKDLSATLILSQII